ncbi:MAG: tRNA lysidine(34) synthetase TilS [Campylobacter sp.]|nr:tRNA lysidine(34) synthetase TilS [Campylobacter sp.]
MLNKEALNKLLNGKNLLAFSYGVDSTALFYLLVQNGINFNLVFINYNTRSNSKNEELAARNLAAKFNKKIYIKQVNFNLENSNFESVARDFRYKFFEEICQEFGYENLITAHQLNDKFEWFLMRLSKGSGVVNALGMNAIDHKKHFFVVRPLIDTSRTEILEFLHANEYKYFIDSSNLNTNFERNFIRAEFSDNFIKKFKNGVKKSFEFLEQDKKHLLNGEIYSNSEFFVIKNRENHMNLIDKALKKLNIVMSQKQRKQALEDCVISGKVVICYTKDCIYIAPYQTHIMDKVFKEKCRLKKVPPLIRGYIFTHQDLLKWF